MTDAQGLFLTAFAAGFFTCLALVVLAAWLATWRQSLRAHARPHFELRRTLRDTLDDGKTAPLSVVKGGRHG